MKFSCFTLSLCTLYCNRLTVEQDNAFTWCLTIRNTRLLCVTLRHLVFVVLFCVGHCSCTQILSQKRVRRCPQGAALALAVSYCPLYSCHSQSSHCSLISTLCFVTPCCGHIVTCSSGLSGSVSVHVFYVKRRDVSFLVYLLP